VFLEVKQRLIVGPLSPRIDSGLFIAGDLELKKQARTFEVRFDEGGQR